MTRAKRPEIIRDSVQIPHARLLLVGILLLAGVLRLQRVTQPLIDEFSWREASTAMMADNFYRTDPNIFFPEVSWTGPGPNYQGREFQTFSWIVAMLWRVFGQHESIGRALSALFGVLGVFAIFKLVRRVWDEPRALASALVLAILPGAIFIDRSFLPDPAMLGLTLVAAWLVVRAAQTGGGLWVAAGVSALAFLTKLPGIVALPMMIYVVTRPHAARPSRNALLAALAILLGPVIAYYAWAIHLGNSYPPYHVAGATNWLWTTGLPRYLGEYFYLKTLIDNLTYWLWTIPVIAFAFAGVFISPPPTHDRSVADVRWAFHYWLGGCGVLYLLGARELSENVWNLHVFNVAAAVFAGHALVVALTWMPGDRGRSTRSIAIGVTGFIAITLAFGRTSLFVMYDSSRRLDSLLMGLALKRHAAPDELVATIADDVGDPISIYYSGRRGWVFPPAHRPDLWIGWNIFPDRPTDSIAMFEDLREHHARWLGIVTRPTDDSSAGNNFWRDQPEVVAHIDATCVLIEKTPNYVIYRIRNAAELAAMPAAVPGTVPAATWPASTTSTAVTEPLGSLPRR